MIDARNRAARARLTTSWLAIGIAVAAAAPAWAQDAGQEPAPAPNAASADRQDTTPGFSPNSPAAEAEDVVIVGTRASLQSAISRKRNAGTTVDSLVAEDVASFPDKNVGEALSRITGVQLTRDFGEGTAVSIRGVEPDLNRVEVNGLSTLSTTGTRSGDLRDLASELIKSIDVFKGFTADMTEGGVGGTVSVQTRRPLELREPLLSVTGSGQYLDVDKRVTPRGNITFGTKFLDNRLGIILNATFDRINTRNDYLRSTNWSRFADFDRSTEKTVANPDYASFATYESCADVPGANAAARTANRLACETQFFDFVPGAPRFSSWTREDQRISAVGTIQYQFTDNFSAYVEGQLNRRNQRLIDVNFGLATDRYERFNFDPALPTVNGAASRPRITAGTFTIDDEHNVRTFRTADNSFISGTNQFGANNILSLQQRDFSYDQDSSYFQAGFDWNWEGLTVTGFGAKSKAKTLNNTNSLALSTSVPGIQVNLDTATGTPEFTFPAGIDPLDARSYNAFDPARVGANGVALTQLGPTVQYRPGENNSKEDQFKIDADYDTGWSFLNRIEVGAQYRKTSILNFAGGGRLLQAANPATGAPAINQTSANVTYNTIITNTPPTTPAVDTFYFTPVQYTAFLQDVIELTRAKFFNGTNVRPGNLFDKLPSPDAARIGDYYPTDRLDQDLVREADGMPQVPSQQVEEDVRAVYLKGNFEARPFGLGLSGNIGVRYIETRTDAAGNAQRRERRVRPGTGTSPTNPPIIEDVAIGNQYLRLKNKYTDWLPAINVALEITPDLVARVGFSKQLARPRPTDLAPNTNCLFDVTDAGLADGLLDSCTAGNPELEPYRADQYDLNVGWYPNADTLLSAAYFRKDIKSFIITGQRRNGVDLFQDGVLYNLTNYPINGSGALLEGLELSAQTVFTFLPSPFDGLGFQANYTYSKANRVELFSVLDGSELPYPGLSKHSYNLIGFYDKGFLNLRVAYNFRTKYLERVVDSVTNPNPIFRKGTGYLDAKATFRFTDNFNIFVEGKNLTEEYEVTNAGSVRNIDVVYSGRRFYAGVTYKF